MRKTVMTMWICVVGMVLGAGEIGWAAPVNTAFIYQGQLTDEGSPAHGAYDFRFKLFVADSGGEPVGGTISKENVEVHDGYFTVELNFGGVFDGDERWLQIDVRPGYSTGAYTLLTPRQALTPTPYALYALDGAGGGGFWTDSGNDIYNTNSGNVGIGTTTPLSKLSLGTTWNPKMMALWDGVNDFYGFGTDIGRITFYAMNSEKMTLNSLGWLGIGTPFPAGYLDITGTADAMTLARINQTGNKQYSGLRLDRSGTEKWFVGMTNADDNLTFRRNAASNDIVIKNTNGNVGIGTTDPQQKLHVSGISQFDLGGGSISLSTPGGWPGVIALSPNGHRRDVQFYNDHMSIAMSETSDAPSSGNGIRIYENGNVVVKVLQIIGGSDLSEQFNIHTTKEDVSLSPGMVVCIDPENPGDLKVSQEAYDKQVAGIISGAGGIKPGMLMGQKGSGADGANPVALTGRVYCRADAASGVIEPGDLLTTSAIPGHAMKVTDYSRANGAILGKAMGSLTEGKGLVLVLVSLQ